MQTGSESGVNSKPLPSNAETVAWSFMRLTTSNIYKFLPRLGFVVPVSYFAGFLIVTSHFYKFGFIEFDVLRADYFLAGGMYLLITSLIATPMFFLTVINNADNSTKTFEWNRQEIRSILFEIFVFIIVSMVIYSLTMYLGSLLDGAIGIGLFNKQKSFFNSPIASYFFSLYLYICLIPFILKIFRKNFLIMVGASIITSVISSVFIYASSIYPLIPPNIGGGQYIRGQIFLAPDTKKQLAKAGLAIESKPVIILRHTANSVYIALNSGDKAIELKRENVIAIQYQ